MEKIRVCFTSPTVNTYSETFIHNIKSGLNADIFHCYGDYFPYLALKGSLQNYKTPPILDLFKKRLGLISLPFREYYFTRFLKKNKIDIIFANYGPSGAELAPLAAKLNIPLVVHFHGFDASIYHLLEKYKILYKKMFEIAYRIIVVSEEMRNDLLKMGAPNDKLFKLIYSPQSRYLKIEPNFSSNQILAIGRFVEKKAPYLTLLAYNIAKETCPDLSLKFIGGGELEAVCKDICKTLNISDVTFDGIKQPDQISLEMGNSFCFVQHSKQAINGDKEGTPVAILEAMATGLPVISTRHAGIPEVIQNGLNGFLVEECDIETMAEKIIFLYNDRSVAKRMGGISKKNIKDLYNSIDYFKKLNMIINCEI